ncbi:MAG: hypothetical protein M3Z31_18670, partial [Pseudomonadota bacterium]|nr:hypothetical protein [Pseudomonadota bacterium]
HWVWHWFAPAGSAKPRAREVNAAPAAIITAAPWFGTAQSAVDAQAQADAGTAAPAATTDGRLIGVIGARNGSGYALLRTADRGAVLVATGQEVAPGVMLEAVTASGIRVSERGQSREIALRPAAQAASTEPKASAQAPRPAAKLTNNTACVPTGTTGTGPIYRLNAELLTGIAAKPDAFSTAFTASRDGLVLREGNAFAAMLGMKGGDRLTQANGVALRGVEDVLSTVVRPLLSSQAVRVLGVHEGRPAEWVFVNASACPS